MVTRVNSDSGVVVEVDEATAATLGPDWRKPPSHKKPAKPGSKE